MTNDELADLPVETSRRRPTITGAIRDAKGSLHQQIWAPRKSLISNADLRLDVSSKTAGRALQPFSLIAKTAQSQGVRLGIGGPYCCFIYENEAVGVGVREPTKRLRHAGGTSHYYQPPGCFPPYCVSSVSWSGSFSF